MSTVQNILSVAVSFENEIVLARQRARQISGLLGFDRQDQTRIATATSEIARNAFMYGGGGKVEFQVQGRGPQMLVITVSDKGPGIRNLEEVLHGQYTSRTGMGLGIVGARRLMDHFAIQSQPGKGTTVILGKEIPRSAGVIGPREIAALSEQLVRVSRLDPIQEMQQQNRELLHTLDELRARTAELAGVNAELEDTNRGVVALYAELDDRADYLQRASELKSRFLSNMSHEFRTPLNSILSLSRLLLDRIDGELTPEQEKQVSFIRRSAEDLSDLVNDLLDLAKVEAGKITVKPSTFDVATLFSALRGLLRPLLLQKSVELIIDEPVDIPVLNTDEAKVSQVLRNLLSNALKYTERGEVRLWVQLAGDGSAVFTVRDTGIGIAKEDQARIFEEWVQVENPLQKKQKGTGLGLPLSRKLAELLGGTLWVESDLGQGSSFHFSIPRTYRGPAEVVYAPEVKTELDPTRLPVLVVEDNQEMLFIYEKYLKGSGFQILPARTIKHAREILAQVRPVAVVLDILLENESTWELLQELKTTSPNVPVLVITMVENQRKAMELGADDFVVKPVEREWLVAKLRSIVKDAARGKLLVIDDDEIARYLLAGVLADTRYEVLQADSGEAGLRQARQEHPQAIILDLLMPDISGFEVLEKLKADPQTARIPVVVYSSKALDDADRRQLQSAAAVLSKNLPREVSAVQLRHALAVATSSPDERATSEAS